MYKSDHTQRAFRRCMFDASSWRRPLSAPILALGTAIYAPSYSIILGSLQLVRRKKRLEKFTTTARTLTRLSWGQTMKKPFENRDSLIYCPMEISGSSFSATTEETASEPEWMTPPHVVNSLTRQNTKMVGRSAVKSKEGNQIARSDKCRSVLQKRLGKSQNPQPARALIRWKMRV